MTTRKEVQCMKKFGDTTGNIRTSQNQQVTTMLEDIKQKAGEVILIAITPRTSIELPAHLTQSEIEARVANYIKLHTSKI